MTLIVTAAFIFVDDWRILPHDLWLSIDSLLCLHGIACTNCFCKCQPSESRFLTVISTFKYLSKQNETSH